MPIFSHLFYWIRNVLLKSLLFLFNVLSGVIYKIVMLTSAITVLTLSSSTSFAHAFAISGVPAL